MEQRKVTGTVGLAGGLNTDSRDKTIGMRPRCFRDEAHLSLPHKKTFGNRILGVVNENEAILYLTLHL